jgi:hypothetical protein
MPLVAEWHIPCCGTICSVESVGWPTSGATVARLPARHGLDHAIGWPAATPAGDIDPKAWGLVNVPMIVPCLDHNPVIADCDTHLSVDAGDVHGIYDLAVRVNLHGDDGIAATCASDEMNG